MKPIPFFLLAGGYGQRTQPLSFYKPKPAFPLHGTPLIRIILEQLKEKGFEDGFINLHHLADKIKECVSWVNLGSGFPIYFYEEKLSGSAILSAAVPYMKNRDTLLVVNGDIFLEIPFREMLDDLNSSEADGIILVRPNTEKKAGYKVILAEEGFFKGRTVLTEEMMNDKTPCEVFMYTGVALLKTKILSRIADINFFDTLERERFQVKVLPYNGIWLDIGDPQSYREANFIYKSYIKQKTGKFSNNENSFSENVKVSADSIVEDSIIWDNTEIKNGSVLRRCIVTGDMVLDSVHYEDRLVTAGGCTSVVLN